MNSIKSLPIHIQTAIKAVNFCLKKFDPQRHPQTIEDLQAAREFLLGSTGLQEKLYDLNAHILDLETEVATLQSTEDRLKTTWEALRDIKIEEFYGKENTTIDMAKGQAKRNPEVTKAQDIYLQKRQARKDKEAEVRYSVRRWNDLHGQEKRAYEVKVREALAPSEENFGEDS